MDFNIEVRRKQLENLEQYISSSRDKVQSIFDCLRWTPERTQEEEAFVQCSIDPAHTVPAKFIEQHRNKCLLHKNGYCKNDVFLSEPLHDPRSSIVIDDHKKIEVLSTAHKQNPNFKSGWNGQDADPKTSERLLTTFSPDERLALYNYVANSTTGPTEVPEFNITQPKRSVDKQLTYEEILAQERDAKRRRTKYKSVHTNHKTHIEIMREVIEGQMELYSDWLLESSVVPNCSLDNLPSNEVDGNSDQSSHQNEKTAEISEVESKADEREQSVISRTSNHSGSTKSTNKKSDYQDYDKHDRKPSRKRYSDHKRNDYRDRSYHSTRDHRDRSSSRKYSHDRERNDHYNNKYHRDKSSSRDEDNYHRGRYSPYAHHQSNSRHGDYSHYRDRSPSHRNSRAQCKDSYRSSRNPNRNETIQNESHSKERIGQNDYGNKLYENNEKH